MAATRFPFFDSQFFAPQSDGTWTVAAGYYLDQYISGTTTDQDTFTDAAGLIANTHPITLDSDGRCTLFGTPGDLYTFVLRASPGGVAVKTWDDVEPSPAALTGSYVPLDGSTPMTGLLTLVSDPTASLNAATKQYVDAVAVATVASVTSLVDAATAAAAEATAAAAAVTPTTFVLSHATGGSATRDIALAVGTYSVILLTGALKSETGSTTYTITVTQSATVGSTTVGTSFPMHRSGGGGYGRDIFGNSFAVGSLVVSAAATFTMSMAAASLSGATGTGSMLIVAKQ